jgi:hypothetical protein
MLRTLEHAKGLLFDEKEEKEEKREEEAKEGASGAVGSDEPRDAPVPSEAKTETLRPQSEEKT